MSAPSGQGEQKANEQPNTVKQRVKAYLEANPDIAQQSVNQVLVTLRAAGIQAGRTTVAEVLHECKQVVSA